MIVLGIESSCDETAVAILNNKKVLSHALYSQIDEHQVYGGVVPEIASRAHMERLDALTTQALAQAEITLDEIDLISVTQGPGLLGGLLIATTFAKSLSWAKNIPVIGVNHLEGHALTAHLTEGIDFPYTLLLASGGHCQFIHVEERENMSGKYIHYTHIGSTLDDAIGECFDKTAKMLGLPYPGGPQIEKYAKLGDPNAFTFPTPLKDGSANFSFSGLKSAVNRTLQEISDPLGSAHFPLENMCASFQNAVAQTLIYKSRKALEVTKCDQFVLAGGVAANKLLREKLTFLCKDLGVSFYAPPMQYCTDNAVMIAYAGLLRAQKGYFGNTSLAPKPRWPLEELNNSCTFTP